MKMRTNRYHS